MQFIKLALSNRGRRIGQRTLGRRGLRERNHVTDGRLTCHQRRNPVETERDTTMGWAAVPERLEQKSKLGLRLLFADAEKFKNRLLHFRPVNTYRASTDFGAVEHDVR